MTTQNEYDCERADLFEQLAREDWFLAFVTWQYRHVVFRNSSLVPEISEYWTRLASKHFAKDVGRVSNKEYDGQPLDHFKRAGFLCFWLRRCPPLYGFSLNPDPIISSVRSRGGHDRTELFYGNQLASFDIGFRICRYWEAARRASPEARERVLRFQPDKDFIADACYISSNKTVSPHSIGLNYRSLFASLPK
jgi:hypothetical protein